MLVEEFIPECTGMLTLSEADCPEALVPWNDHLGLLTLCANGDLAI